MSSPNGFCAARPEKFYRGYYERLTWIALPASAATCFWQCSLMREFRGTGCSAELKKLPLGSYEFNSTRAMRGGLAGLRVDIRVPGSSPTAIWPIYRR